MVAMLGASIAAPFAMPPTVNPSPVTSTCLACVSVGGFGIALKSRDGAARARGPAVLFVLEQFDVTDGTLLPQHREPPVMGAGDVVGTLRARGSLARA